MIAYQDRTLQGFAPIQRSPARKGALVTLAPRLSGLATGPQRAGLPPTEPTDLERSRRQGPGAQKGEGVGRYY